RSNDGRAERRVRKLLVCKRVPDTCVNVEVLRPHPSRQGRRVVDRRIRRIALVKRQSKEAEDRSVCTDEPSTSLKMTADSDESRARTRVGRLDRHDLELRRTLGEADKSARDAEGNEHAQFHREVRRWRARHGFSYFGDSVHAMPGSVQSMK